MFSVLIIRGKRGFFIRLLKIPINDFLSSIVKVVVEIYGATSFSLRCQLARGCLGIGRRYRTIFTTLRIRAALLK